MTGLTHRQDVPYLTTGRGAGQVQFQFTFHSAQVNAGLRHCIQDTWAATALYAAPALTGQVC